MANPNLRSATVTAAATLVILGCGSAFLLWGYFFLSLTNSPPDNQGRHFYQAYSITFLLVALVPCGVIAAGLRTGIGLFQLRPWARIMAMVWASVTLLFCLTLIAIRPFETFFFPENFVGPTESLKQLVSIALVIFLLPVSVWWLFLFRMKSVKAQFGAGESGEGEKKTGVTGET